VIKTCTNNYNVKINASETKTSQIADIFDLRFEEGKVWSLAKNSLVKIPLALSMCQHSSLAHLYSNANY
jgi:hypothetical protein